MKLLLAIVLLAVISLVGSRLTFISRRFSIGFRNIFFTGTEYILIGVLLGGGVLGVLDAATLEQLMPFFLFGLSWIGFLFGLQFEVKRLKALPHRYFSITAIQSVVVFAAVFFATFFTVRKFVPFPETFVLTASITLGAAAVNTAQSAIAVVNRNYKIENRGLLGLMRYISSVDGLFAIIFFSVALFIAHSGIASNFDYVRTIEWFIVSMLMGIIPAVILIFLSRTRFSQREFMVFLIGVIMFCGGLADRLHFSSLVSGLVCGVITANYCPHRLRALSIVVHAEKSIYIMLLLLLGAGWQFRIDAMLVVAVIYFVARIVGKLAGAFAATRIFKPRYDVPAKLGLGFISEGGITVAIMISFGLLYPSIADGLTTIIILSVFVNEYISPALIVRQFGDVLRLKKEKPRPEDGHDGETL